LTVPGMCAILPRILHDFDAGVRDMWNGLEKLLDLQKLDIAIARLEAESRTLPQEIQALESRLAGARSGLDQARTGADHLQKERRAKERDLDEATLNIKKKQARLFEIKTNEEYSAVLREIESLKAKASKIEEEVLDLLERSDLTAKTVAHADREFKTAETQVRQERAQKGEQLARVSRELADLQEARKGQASRLEADLLRQYTRLLKSRGVAVVAVKDGSCSGCGIALTPQTNNEVRRNDRLFTCSACNRILYFVG